MHLTDLEPQFYRHGYQVTPEGTVLNDRETLHKVATLVDAQCVLFACPLCFKTNGGLGGTHYVLVWFRDRGVPAEARPLPRWIVAGGTGFHDLTLTPSIHLSGEGGCQWHGFVTNGEAT